MQVTKDVIMFTTTKDKVKIIPLDNLLCIGESDGSTEYDKYLSIIVSFNREIKYYFVEGEIKDWWELFKNKEQLDVETS